MAFTPCDPFQVVCLKSEWRQSIWAYYIKDKPLPVKDKIYTVIGCTVVGSWKFYTLKEFDYVGGVPPSRINFNSVFFRIPDTDFASDTLEQVLLDAQALEVENLIPIVL